MRKCGLMFGLFIIVLIIASKVKEIDKDLNENLIANHELHVKAP